MKTISRFGATFLFAVGLFFTVGCATSNQPLPRETAGGLIIDDTERVAVVTGSYIPRKVRVKSIGTDTAQNVRIITQKELIRTNGGFGVGGISSLIGR